VFFQRFGVDVFLKKVQQLTQILATAAMPAASGGVAQASWFELINRLPPSALPQVAPGAANNVLDAASRPIGQAVPSGASKVHSRATTGLVLSIVALPMCCLPLGLVGGGLALSARSEAAKQGITPPGNTVVSLVLAGLSSAMFILMLVIGALAPKDSKAQPVPVASANAAPMKGALVQVPIGGNGEEPPGLFFDITKVYEKHAPSKKAPFHAKGGDWTYFDAVIDSNPDCAFTVGVAPAKTAGGFGFGKVQLSVKDRVAASCVVEKLADGLGVDVPEKKPGNVGGPLELATAVLGERLSRQKGGGFGGDGDGSWTATKLFLEKGETYGEVFFNYDLDSKRGEFSEKDFDYDHDVVAVLASELRDAPANAAAKPARRKHR